MRETAQTPGSYVAWVGVASKFSECVQVFVPYANASTTNETAQYLDSHLVHTGQFFSTDAMNTYVSPFRQAQPPSAHNSQVSCV